MAVHVYGGFPLPMGITRNDTCARGPRQHNHLGLGLGFGASQAARSNQQLFGGATPRTT